MKRRDFVAAAAGAIVATALAGGIAWAAIPEGGVIQGCYDSGGNLKIVAALPCPKGHTPLQWNQQGVQGVPGEDGADGVSPAVTPLDPGDANCPTGGAAISDANTTAYVCSGADGHDGQDGAAGDPFSGTFTSPNGEYAIGVTDGGITIAHGSSNAILLVGDDLTVQSDDVTVQTDDFALQTDDFALQTDDLAVQSTRSTTLRAGTTMTVDVTGNLSLITSATGLLRAAGPLNLQGSVVNIN